MAIFFDPSFLAGNTYRTTDNPYTEGNTTGNNVWFDGASNWTGAGEAGNDFLVGNSGSDVISGLGGNDTLWGGSAGADVLAGNSGADVFLYGSTNGNDSIVDFGTGADTIALYDVTVGNTFFSTPSNFSRDGGNAYFTFSSGNVLTIANSDATKGLTVADQNGVQETIFIGTSANNVLTGTTGNDIVFGGSGNETIAGGGGSDVFYGGAGADLFLYAGGNNDTIMDYGVGADVIKLVGNSFADVSYTRDARNVMFTVSGGNTLTVANASITGGFTVQDSGGNVETIFVGNDANNSISGTNGNDILVGLGGSDTLAGGLGNDVLIGGTGNDVFVFGTSAGLDTVSDYGNGNDTIKLSNASMSALSYNRSGGNVVFSLNSNDKLYVVDGNADDAFAITDTTGITKKVKVGSDSSAATFTYANDVNYYTANVASTLIVDSANLGDKVINLFDTTTYKGITTVTALGGDDQIRGTGADETFNAGAGNDYLWGAAGNDALTGGAGNDLFAFGTGDGKDSILDYGTGSDTINLYNVAFNAVTFGRTGGNAVFTLNSNDKLYVVDGNADDTFVITDNTGVAKKVKVGSDSSAATFTYANDVNYYTANVASTLIVDSANLGDKVINLFDTTAYKGITTVTALDGNDQLRGTGLNETFNAGAGNDYLWGAAGNDALTGGAGNDLFAFGTGDGKDSVLDYGVGSDTINLYNVAFNAVTFGRTGGNAVFTLNSNDKLYVANSDADGAFVITDNTGVAKKVKVGSDSSAATFTYANDVNYYTANVASTLIVDSANLGDKVINLFDTTAYKGITTVTALDGNDQLRGTGLNETFNAGAGNDYLWGAAGNDALTGGAGNDLFAFGTGDGKDSVLDYGVGSDTINLYNVAFNAVTFGRTGGNAVFTLSANDKLYVANSDADGAFVITDNTGVAKKVKVGSDSSAATFTYANDVNYYTANVASTLIVDSANLGDKVINLFDTTTYNGIATVTALDGNDQLRGTVGNDSLNGGAGNDYIWGYAGSDTLTGGTGNDSFWFGTGDGQDLVTDYGNIAGTNFDTINLYSASNYAVDVNYTRDAGNVGFTWGTNTTDKLYVTGTDVNMIYTVSTGSGANIGTGTVKIGGDGQTFAYDPNANLYVANSGFTLDATNQTSGIVADLFNSTKFRGVNVALGGSGDDQLRGTTGNDTLNGGSGNDYLWGYAGNDLMIGGAGNNSFWFGTGDGSDTVSDYFTNVDTINLYSATAYNSDVKYNRSASNVSFTWGNNTTDTLYATVNAGDDQNTIYTVAASSGADINSGKVKIGSNGQTFAYDSTVNLYAANSAATLDASSQTSGIVADLFNSTKFRGVTTAMGGSGDDQLRGSTGNDTLVGGAGNDYLWGYAGNDVMTGGAGSDSYWFGTGDGNDTITGAADNYLDTVMLYTSGLTTADITNAVVGTNLVMTIQSSGETLTIQNWANSDTGYKINRIGVGGGSSSSGTSYYQLNTDGSWGTKIS